MEYYFSSLLVPQLKERAQHYSLPFKKNIRKQELVNLIVDHLHSNDVHQSFSWLMNEPQRYLKVNILISNIK